MGNPRWRSVSPQYPYPGRLLRFLCVTRMAYAKISMRIRRQTDFLVDCSCNSLQGDIEQKLPVQYNKIGENSSYEHRGVYEADKS